MGRAFQMDVARWVRPQKVAALSEITPLKTLKLLNAYLPLQAMFWFRLGHWFRSKHIPLGGLIQKFIFLVFGLEIVIGADIEGGLYIAHPIGTVIAPAKIGKNCTIIANVTIGMRNEWKFPTIGDNVFIGAGARVLGGITIGDDAVIGANAVVIHDVPAGATVVGIPARIIRLNGERVEAAQESGQQVENDLELLSL